MSRSGRTAPRRRRAPGLRRHPQRRHRRLPPARRPGHRRPAPRQPPRPLPPAPPAPRPRSPPPVTRLTPRRDADETKPARPPAPAKTAPPRPAQKKAAPSASYTRRDFADALSKGPGLPKRCTGRSPQRPQPTRSCRIRVLQAAGDVRENTSDQQDIALNGRISLQRDAQLDLTVTLADQELGMAIRSARDFDQNITDGFPARPDLIEIRTVHHNGPECLRPSRCTFSMVLLFEPHH